MKYYHVSYATDSFKERQNQMPKIYEGFGIEKFFMYSPSDIDEKFFKKNKKVLSESRGAGYWLWKPYLILKTLNEVEFGDVVIYSDCGDMIYKEAFDYIKNSFNDGFFLQHHQYTNNQYVKGDCFLLMRCWDNYYANANHLEAGFCGFIKSEKTIKFVKEWLKHCSNFEIISDGNVHGPNFPGFIDHRHDQSILSLLAIKHKIKTNDIRNSQSFIKYNYL